MAKSSALELYQTRLCEFAGFRSSRLGTLFVATGNTLLPQPVFGRYKRRQDTWVCHHRRMAKKHSLVLHFAREIFGFVFLMWKCWFENTFSPLCFAFCQVQYHQDPNEHYLASCQTKHLPARRLIMERSMWWERFLWTFCGNKLMKLQKQSFLPCSLNLNKWD